MLQNAPHEDPNSFRLEDASFHGTAKLKRATMEVAEHYYGERGLWSYEMFEAINDTFFDGKLPWPHIVWALTPHGACLGYTSAGRAPVVVLHPSLLGGTEKVNPWGVPERWLGPAYAFDVLLHESIHVNVEYCLGGWQGEGTSSHNNEVWIAEVNRLAPV